VIAVLSIILNLLFLALGIAIRSTSGALLCPFIGLFFGDNGIFIGLPSNVFAQAAPAFPARGSVNPIRVFRVLAAMPPKPGKHGWEWGSTSVLPDIALRATLIDTQANPGILDTTAGSLNRQVQGL
jgi:hypothetical protein